MARCGALTRGGGRCRGVANDSAGLCYAHSPEHAEERRRAASKGGKRGGRGRPVVELAEVKRLLREMAASVMDGKANRSNAAVAGQLLNTYIRAVGVELKIREQQELAERLEALEEAIEQQKEARGRRGA